MAIIPVRCPSCDEDAVVKRGKTDRGKQRYLCQNETCSHRTFLLDYTNRGYMPSVKRQIIDLTLNGSGIRDIARVLRISTDTVIGELKKKKASLRQ
jgi:transposase-like protein